jgi:hypothetical protein
VTEPEFEQSPDDIFLFARRFFFHGILLNKMLNKLEKALNV